MSPPDMERITEVYGLALVGMKKGTSLLCQAVSDYITLKIPGLSNLVGLLLEWITEWVLKKVGWDASKRALAIALRIDYLGRSSSPAKARARRGGRAAGGAPALHRCTQYRRHAMLFRARHYANAPTTAGTPAGVAPDQQVQPLPMHRPQQAEPHGRVRHVPRRTRAAGRGLHHRGNH
jgi:hypothetical protein